MLSSLTKLSFETLLSENPLNVQVNDLKKVQPPLYLELMTHLPSILCMHLPEPTAAVSAMNMKLWSANPEMWFAQVKVHYVRPHRHLTHA